MNQAKFEKIDGREALKLLLDGKTVLNSFNETHLLDGARLVFIRKSGAYETVNDGLKQILETTWYTPKPFDIRQEMRDKPDEWVGAFHNEEAEWCKVGFDTKHMNAIYKPFNSHLPVSTDVPGVSFPTPEDLDNCVSIEDVPEEATR